MTFIFPSVLSFLLLAKNFCYGANQESLIIGSKKFTENVILGEIMRLSLKEKEIPVRHQRELGGTRILWNALLNGDIDIYPEYTGTILAELLKNPNLTFEEIKSELKDKGIGVSRPLGFNNTYALGMKKKLALTFGILKISDLAKHPNLKIAFGEEFLERKDGWPGLRKAYHLPQKFVRAIDHDISYRALETEEIQLTDLYSTDAEIEYYNLISLQDDFSYFPKYESVFLYRLDALESYPALKNLISRLEGKISARKMIAMNKKSKIDKMSSTEVAYGFLEEVFSSSVSYKVATRSERIGKTTLEHLRLVGISLCFAILCAIPLGVLSVRFSHFGQWVLWLVGFFQTVPSLALLVILIKPLNMMGLSGIGDTPAIIALFLYSLLPIVRGTYAGFQQIPKTIHEVSSVLNLRNKTKLFRIEFPLALISIFSGIKTAAVLNIGFATLGALVGAGGYGQPILRGIRLDDYGLILEGAIPAAILSFVAQKLFDILEVRLISPGLQK